jgi:hypothetical protein
MLKEDYNLYVILSFLAHLAKGHVSFCHHLVEGGAVEHNFERDPPSHDRLNLVQRFQRRSFKCESLFFFISQIVFNAENFSI